MKLLEPKEDQKARTEREREKTTTLNFMLKLNLGEESNMKKVRI